MATKTKIHLTRFQEKIMDEFMRDKTQSQQAIADKLGLDQGSISYALSQISKKLGRRSGYLANLYPRGINADQKSYIYEEEDLE